MLPPGKMGPKMQLPDNVVVHEPKVGIAAADLDRWCIVFGPSGCFIQILLQASNFQDLSGLIYALSLVSFLDLCLGEPALRRWHPG